LSKGNKTSTTGTFYDIFPSYLRVIVARRLWTHSVANGFVLVILGSRVTFAALYLRHVPHRNDLTYVNDLDL